MSDGKVKVAKLVGSEPHDVVSLLSASGRDLLVRNNGDQIKVESLKEKKLGLYFSASWCSTCERLTPALVEAYNELSPKGDFGIVFISADEDDESFKGYFAKMSWLAIPFSDSKARNRVDELFKVREIPHIVILGEDEAASGKIKDSHEVSPESQSSITSHVYLKSPTAASLDKDVVLRSSPPKFGIRRQRVSGCGGYGGGFELDKSFWEFG
ncbi:hypothetical protein ACFX2I_007585 [Malus domestica]